MNHFDHLKSLLSISSQIHDWEMNNLSEFNSLSGKIIFAKLLDEFCKTRDVNIPWVSVKENYSFDLVCYKTLLTKLKELKKQGFIELTNINEDFRGKNAVPTNKLISLFKLYVIEINKIINNYFYLVPLKENSTNNLSRNQSPSYNRNVSSNFQNSQATIVKRNQFSLGFAA